MYEWEGPEDKGLGGVLILAPQQIRGMERGRDGGAEGGREQRSEIQGIHIQHFCDLFSHALAPGLHSRDVLLTLLYCNTLCNGQLSGPSTPKLVAVYISMYMYVHYTN